MHEVSIALAIVDEVCERAEAEKIARIESVFVKIGTLTGVVPDALQFAWGLAAEGTPASGSRLVIDRIPLVIYCMQCTCDRTITGSPIPVCRVCGTSSSEIISGRELLVTAMEVSDAASSGGRPTKHPSQEHHVST